MKRLLILLVLCCTQVMNAQTARSNVVVVDHSLITVYEGVPEHEFPGSKLAVLTTQDYVAIEILVTRFLDEYNAQQRKEIKERRLRQPNLHFDENQHIIHWKSYWKQYCAVITQNGDKELWINCFCQKSWPDKILKQHIMMVEDGGNCFFNLKINLSKKICYNLSVNGVA